MSRTLVLSLLLVSCHHRTDGPPDPEDTDVVDTNGADTDTQDTDTHDTDTVVTPVDVRCANPEDCQLWESCCDCLPMSASATGPSCGMPECFATACTAVGLFSPTTTCSVGRCVFDHSCDATQVTCRAVTPECPAGQVPSVVDACWGPCLPVTQCSRVTDCGVCGSDQVCVTQVANAPAVHHCVATTPTCTTCDCLGESVCTGSFGICGDVGTRQIECSCPTCR